MAFIEMRIPIKIPPGSGRNTVFLNQHSYTASGWHQGNQLASAPLRTWDIRRWICSEADFLQAYHFFLAIGTNNGFRFKDLDDFQSRNPGDEVRPQLAAGSAANIFQLQKAYAAGGQYLYREIKKPVDGSVRIYVAGVLQQSGVSVDSHTGIVTFGSTPAATPEAEFEFDVPVQFASDEFPNTWEAFRVFGADITLREVRV